MCYLPRVQGQDGRLLTNHNWNSTLLPSGRDSNIKKGMFDRFTHIEI